MKIAAIQMCSGSSLDKNLSTVTQLVAEASSNGASLVVLPEMFPLMGEDSTEKLLIKEKYKKGPLQDFLSHLAKQHNLWVVGGTIPIEVEESNKINAACLVYSNEGDEKARYDKMHLFDVTLSASEYYKESDTTLPGREAVVVETPLGKLGLAVCYDIRFPDLFTQLAARGAEIIAIPAAFTLQTGQAHWEVLTRARALDTFSYIVASCQGGAHANGRKTYGHSLIVNPWGVVMDELSEEDGGIVYCEIALDYLYKVRSTIPTLQHR